MGDANESVTSLDPTDRDVASLLRAHVVHIVALHSRGLVLQKTKSSKATHGICHSNGPTRRRLLLGGFCTRRHRTMFFAYLKMEVPLRKGWSWKQMQTLPDTNPATQAVVCYNVSASPGRVNHVPSLDRISVWYAPIMSLLLRMIEHVAREQVDVEGDG